MNPIRVIPSTRIPEVVIIILLVLFGITTLVMNVQFGVEDLGIYVIVGLIFGLFMVRSLIQMVVLRRTTYTITDEVLRKEFRMFYRRYEREVPLDQLRGVELTQTALQNVFDFGTITAITAGPNRSLGFIEFKHIPEPARYREIIRERITGETAKPRGVSQSAPTEETVQESPPAPQD